MKIDEKHSAVILERVFDCQDKYELIDLVSGRDKIRTPIHRVILMAASKYFADLFRTNNLDEQPEEFVVDSDGEVIKTVVDFCYSGHIDLTEQNVEKCLKIAMDGEIDLLLNKCHGYFAAKLSSETVVDVLSIAEKYNLDDLQRRASELLCSDLEQVQATQTLQMNPAMMLHLMENVGEAVSSDLVAERLLSWFQNAEAARGEHMPKMLRLIRLEQLSGEFLCETIEPIFKQFKCTELLYNELKRRAIHPIPSSGCLSARDDKAATSENIVVYLFGRRRMKKGQTKCIEQCVIVQRLDWSLNKFTPYFTSPSIGCGYSSLVSYENKLFVVKRPMFAYDMKTGKEERLLSMTMTGSSYKTVVMGKSFYVLGGFDGNGASSSCERYDMEKGTWQIIKSMSQERYSLSAAVLNGLIYVVGGLEFEHAYPHPVKISTLVESYDPETDQWTKRKALDLEKGADIRSLVAFNGLLYAFVVGQGVGEYDPVENIWTKISTDYKFRNVMSAKGSLFAITEDGRFGKVAINERKIDFIEITKIDTSTYNHLPLQ